MLLKRQVDLRAVDAAGTHRIQLDTSNFGKESGFDTFNVSPTMQRATLCAAAAKAFSTRYAAHRVDHAAAAIAEALSAGTV